SLVARLTRPVIWRSEPEVFPPPQPTRRNTKAPIERKPPTCLPRVCIQLDFNTCPQHIGVLIPPNLGNGRQSYYFHIYSDLRQPCDIPNSFEYSPERPTMTIPFQLMTLQFTNTEIAFRSKSDAALRRSYWLFRAF